MDIFGTKKANPNAIDVALRRRVAENKDLITRKNNVELELLTKIRDYGVKRSVIEAEYGKALQALREECRIEDKRYEELGIGRNSVYGIWNSYLDAVKRLGTQHESLGQFYCQNTAKNARNAKLSKMDAIKKCTEELKKCTQELTASSRYAEKSRQAHLQACLALSKRESGKKKKIQLDQLEKAVNDSRNLYLIRLLDTRTHENWYTNTALTKFTQDTESSVYDNIWTYLSSTMCIEIERSQYAHQQFTDMSRDMEKLPNSESYHHQFSQILDQLQSKYESEPSPPGPPKWAPLVGPSDDPLLVSEAKTWISSKIRAEKTLETACETSGRQDQIRRAEVTKLKAEAILRILDRAGVNCEELAEGSGNLQAYGCGSVMSINALVNSADETGSIHCNGLQPITELFDLSLAGSRLSVSANPIGSALSNEPIFHCRAKYNYAGKDPDELTFDAGDTIRVIDQKPHYVEDGWWKGRVVNGRYSGRLPGTFPSMLVEKVSDNRKVTIAKSTFNLDSKTSAGERKSIDPRRMTWYAENITQDDVPGQRRPSSPCHSDDLLFDV